MLEKAYVAEYLSDFSANGAAGWRFLNEESATPTTCSEWTMLGGYDAIGKGGSVVKTIGDLSDHSASSCVSSSSSRTVYFFFFLLSWSLARRRRVTPCRRGRALRCRLLARAFGVRATTQRPVMNAPPSCGRVPRDSRLLVVAAWCGLFV